MEGAREVGVPQNIMCALCIVIRLDYFKFASYRPAASFSVAVGMASAVSSLCPTWTLSFICWLREFRDSVTFVSAALQGIVIITCSLGGGREGGEDIHLYVTVFYTASGCYQKSISFHDHIWLLSCYFSLGSTRISLLGVWTNTYGITLCHVLLAVWNKVGAVCERW